MLGLQDQHLPPSLLLLGSSLDLSALFRTRLSADWDFTNVYHTVPVHQDF